MKLLVAGTCVVLLSQSLSAAPLQQSAAGKGSIEGVVVRSGTGQPIPGARVTLAVTFPANGNNPPASTATPGLPGTRVLTCVPGIDSGSGATSIFTDGQGRFIFKDIDAATYCIAAGANGYAKQAYGQRASSGQGTPIKINAGQVIRDIVVPLTPAGTIFGRIRDNSGQPITGILVQLLKSTFNANGQRVFQSSGTARSDDRGEYRLYWITPGRYFVMAGSALSGITSAAFGSPNEIMGESIQPTYYPNSTDVSQAAGVDVKPGSEIGGVDFLLTRQPSFRIRGRVIDGRTGQVPTSVNVTLVNVLPTGNSNLTSSQSYNPREGTFELKDVSAGLHVVRAQYSGASNTTVTPGNSGVVTNLIGQSGTAQIALNVTSDMDGVVLILANGASLPGQLVMEGQASFAGFDRMRVQLRPSVDGVIIANIGGPTPNVQSVGTNGTFRIDNILSGEYRIAVTSLPPDAYVKQARLNQVDILNKPMQFLTSDSGTVEIVLSPGGGELDGVVQDDKQRPVQGVEAVLVPDHGRDRIDLYKTAVTDAGGRFSLRGIAPGDYHVFSWETLDPYAYFDPDVLKADEQNGKAIHITEGFRGNLDLKIIPVP